MKTFGSTIRGNRDENQDRFIIFTPSDDFTFSAITDGMGGVIGGGIASQIIIETVEKVIKIFYEDWNREFNLKNVLLNIYAEAQSSIRMKILENPELEGMGATLSCLLIHNNKFVWGNIGDTRIYKLTKSKCIRMTKDHTKAEEYSANKHSDTAQEFAEYYSNILTKAVNGKNDQPDIYPKFSIYHELNINEGFLICSDGLLINKLGNEEEVFHDHFIKNNSIKEFVNSLISNAYQMGSNDNITCVAIVKDK